MVNGAKGRCHFYPDSVVAVVSLQLPREADLTPQLAVLVVEVQTDGEEHEARGDERGDDALLALVHRRIRALSRRRTCRRRGGLGCSESLGDTD